MTERLAKSLVMLRQQVNALRPGRDKASDGWIGDRAHRNRKSDHNPNSAGVVQAVDIDEDLAPGEDAGWLVRALQASRDPRLKYIIYEGRITIPGDVTKWKPYKGENPHRHHVHISVSNARGLYDDDREWDLSGQIPVTAPETPSNGSQPELRRGAKGESVRRLQMALRARGELIEIDGDFGRGTEKAVKSFQIEKGLRPDGIAGAQTNQALGL